MLIMKTAAKMIKTPYMIQTLSESVRHFQVPPVAGSYGKRWRNVSFNNPIRLIFPNVN